MEDGMCTMIKLAYHLSPRPVKIPWAAMKG